MKELRARNSMYTFYEYPKCSTCRRAKAELNQLELDYIAHDLVKETPSEQELVTWMKNSDLTIKSFFNTSGQKYRELGLKEKVAQFSIEESAKILTSDGMLIKRPILLKNNRVLQIGYRTPYRKLNI